jgi:hypothetical protein
MLAIATSTVAGFIHGAILGLALGAADPTLGCSFF